LKSIAILKPEISHTVIIPLLTTQTEA